ncbi:MAG: hypothetical protein NXI29_15985 [bacterium]|nr:hypothetical protein [bacterium]
MNGDSDIQNLNYKQMKSFIERNPWTYSEILEGDTKRFDLKSGRFKCCVKIYKTGTIQIQGAESKLKNSLLEAKTAIDNEELVTELLPFEIERFPEVLSESIPSIDPIIVRFITEAITSVRAGSLLGCAFLLGGASEKSILLLIDSYTAAIEDETLQNKFISRTSGKFISRSFEEFKKSFNSSKNKPKGFGWTNDLEIKIENIFQFCRICRNEAGHPHLPPNLDKGVLLANMGQFVKYVTDLYALIEYYGKNKVEL